MSIYDDWKMCLFGAIGMFLITLFSGSILGLTYFWMFYYLALLNFDKEINN